MCTTYLAYKIAGMLKGDGARFLDYPRLVRLNPNIPWKTRGNGAVSMRVMTDNPGRVKEKIKRIVASHSDTKNGANPGLVFYQGPDIPRGFEKFSRNALWKLIRRRDAKEFAAKNNIESFHLGNGQGMIGAISAIGYKFADSTVEMLSYRKRRMFGKTRIISPHSVKKMQEDNPGTFNSYDAKRGKILIAPHGPDPVFYGLRGESPDMLYAASRTIRFDEKLDGYMIFRSNQGTGDHLRNSIDVHRLAPYTSGVIEGTILKSPVMYAGGYVLFSLLCDKTEVNCAVYKPTGLSGIALEMMRGDMVRVGGGVRKSTPKHPRVINVETIRMLHLEKKIVSRNPACQKCGKSMKSKGRNQGFACVRCKTRSLHKVSCVVRRNIKKIQYIPKVTAHRHLTRPRQRMGMTNSEIVFDDSSPWHVQY